MKLSAVGFLEVFFWPTLDGRAKASLTNLLKFHDISRCSGVFRCLPMFGLGCPFFESSHSLLRLQSHCWCLQLLGEGRWYAAGTGGDGHSRRIKLWQESQGDTSIFYDIYKDTYDNLGYLDTFGKALNAPWALHLMLWYLYVMHVPSQDLYSVNCT